jgi:hypothetical protein
LATRWHWKKDQQKQYGIATSVIIFAGTGASRYIMSEEELEYGWGLTMKEALWYTFCIGTVYLIQFPTKKIYSVGPICIDFVYAGPHKKDIQTRLYRVHV